MTSQQEVALAVKRLQWRHHREGNRRLTAGAQLSLPQWDVLRHLAAHPDASLHALAEATFQTDQSIGELAKRMTNAGLMRRRQGAGRAVRHELTAEGDAAFRAGSRIFDEVLRQTVGKLSDQERTQLLALIEKAMTN